MYLLPLVGTLLSGVFSGSTLARFYGHRGAGVCSVLCLFVSFVSSLLMWYEVVFASSEVFIDLFGSWFTVGSFNVYWALYFDLTAVHLLLTVTSVSFAVHCYALVYMKSDPHLNLFMCYLSLFTFFMCVLVTGQDLIVMLVGWEGIHTQCLNDWCNTHCGADMTQSVTCVYDKAIFCSLFTQKRKFYKPRVPAEKRIGSHSPLFKHLLIGFLLCDGWLEPHGRGVRLGISLTQKFRDVASWYKRLLYALGYVHSDELGNPLIRAKSEPYYQIRTFTFSSLIQYYNEWYVMDADGKIKKNLPSNVNLTPLSLAVWIMGDGSGMKDGGFKISSHSFTKEENEFLCNLLYDLYGIKANVLHEKNKNLLYIRVWKRSVNTLYVLVKPYLLPSCYYKFRFVNKSANE